MGLLLKQQQKPPAPLLTQEMAPRVPEEGRRDWAGGLPAELLEKVAETLVAQHEAGVKAYLKGVLGWREKSIQEEMEYRKRDGNCLLVFALVCKGWRKAQLKVGGPLRTRVDSDVVGPGSMALVKWALAEGCPREEWGWNMVHAAARRGQRELVQWLCGEGGFAMDASVMAKAALSGDLELVRWLRAEGCEWNWMTCLHAVLYGRVEVLRWARANGAPWNASTRDRAAAKLGYTDDLGNLV